MTRSGRLTLSARMTGHGEAALRSASAEVTLCAKSTGEFNAVPDTQTNPQTSILKPKLQAMPAKIHPSPQQQANTSTQTPKVFRSKSGTKKRASYAEEPTSALLDHDSDRVVYPEPQELFYTPTSSDIDASPNNSTQASPALPTTSNESTQTDAPPATSSESVQEVQVLMTQSVLTRLLKSQK